MKKYLSHYSLLKESIYPLCHKYYADIIEHLEKTEYTVRNRGDIGEGGNNKYYLLTQKVPPNSFIVKNDIAQVAVGLMFIQFAKGFDLFETIILGNLLCSHVDKPLSKLCMKKDDLMAYVVSAKGVYGQKKALRALTYVQEGACSIMEIFVQMFLRLPIFMGGLGLNGGLFNYRIDLNSNNTRILNQSVFFVDYCFPKEKIIYEYQGEHHNYIVDKDSVRSIVLRSMGYQIISVTKTILYDPHALIIFLKEVAKIHGIRFRIRTKKFETSIARIQELLPRIKDPNKKNNTILSGQKIEM